VENSGDRGGKRLRGSDGKGGGGSDGRGEEKGEGRSGADIDSVGKGQEEQKQGEGGGEDEGDGKGEGGAQVENGGRVGGGVKRKNEVHVENVGNGSGEGKRLRAEGGGADQDEGEGEGEGEREGEGEGESVGEHKGVDKDKGGAEGEGDGEGKGGAEGEGGAVAVAVVGAGAGAGAGADDGLPVYMRQGASGKLFVGNVGIPIGCGARSVHKGFPNLTVPDSRHKLTVVHYPNGWVPVANPRTSSAWDPLKPAISLQVSDHSLWVGDIHAQAHFPTKQPEGKLAFVDFSSEPFGSHMVATNRDTLYMHVPFGDNEEVGVAALHKFVTVPFMVMAISQGRKLLVNCQAGCNR
jgi:hypothetical protein